jgi:hypothetical protein
MRSQTAVRPEDGDAAIGEDGRRSFPQLNPHMAGLADLNQRPHPSSHRTMSAVRPGFPQFAGDRRWRSNRAETWCVRSAATHPGPFRGVVGGLDREPPKGYGRKTLEKDIGSVVPLKTRPSAEPPPRQSTPRSLAHRPIPVRACHAPLDQRHRLHRHRRHAVSGGQRRHEAVALGFVSARVFEAAIIVRQDLAGGAGTDDGSLVAIRDWTLVLGPSLIPGVNACSWAT